MKVSIEKNVLSPNFRVQFEVNEFEFAAWQFKRFGCARPPSNLCQVGEALFLLSEFYKDNTANYAGMIQKVDVEVVEPAPQLPPSQ
jgi:hypothetical protein